MHNKNHLIQGYTYWDLEIFNDKVLDLKLIYATLPGIKPRTLDLETWTIDTYLIEHFIEAEVNTQRYGTPLVELDRHGLQALCDTLQQDKDLNINNTSLCIIREGRPFEVVEGEVLLRYLDLLGEDAGRTRATGLGGVPANTTSGSNNDLEPSEPAATVLFEAAEPRDTDS
ncbi:hypothetical protein [Parasitella parasitica]|uniref:Uncharacterized protein n=1 Tax=Parasitella parasitica TaxID=35722 RepID=A0A0B7MS54_9FUNG|nr:hypothetical protein [Parasitella parasitica]